MLNNIFRFFRTIIHLKLIQIFYQLKYRFFGITNYNKKLIGVNNLHPFYFLKTSHTYNFEKKSFIFLNHEYIFKNKIDWDYSRYGKLWTYNLNYFDFLNQKDIKRNQAVLLIKNFIENAVHFKTPHEPYPTSLRIINWIKFLVKNKINDHQINQFLYNEFCRLKNNLEYHLLGNHLLENHFALWFCQHYFLTFDDKKKFSNKLLSLLNNQLFSDGAHYELTPMYHDIILSRLIDCISLSKSNPNEWNISILDSLENSASKMLGWSLKMKFTSNDELPLINDSTNGVSFPKKKILQYAIKIGIKKQSIKLSDSLFRILNNSVFKLIVDLSNSSPKYQPGHSHADNLNFLLAVNNNPIIVDPGITTYEKTKIRIQERSTNSHNTVSVNDINNNEIWNSFRMGRRAKTIIQKEMSNQIHATHDGYRNINLEHKRIYFINKESVSITDILNKSGIYKSKLNLHLHPSVKINKIFNDYLILNNNIKIHFIGSKKIKLKKYSYSKGFNLSESSNKIIINFKDKLVTKFSLRV